MNDLMKLLYGYKTYILVMAYMIFVMATGQPMSGEDPVLGGLSAEAVQKELLAGVLLALKAKWNRTNPG